ASADRQALQTFVARPLLGQQDVANCVRQATARRGRRRLSGDMKFYRRCDPTRFERFLKLGMTAPCSLIDERFSAEMPAGAKVHDELENGTRSSDRANDGVCAVHLCQE